MLKTKNVFIDTQYYVKAGLHFESKTFEYFRSLCNNGDLVLLTTLIIENEVNSKIDDSIKDALQAVQTIKRKARFLKNIKGNPLECFFQTIAEGDVYDLAKKGFRDFLDDCNAIDLPLDEVNIENVVMNYFDEKPPFGSGKKKHEFPDALSLEAINAYIGDEGVYIISEDMDLIKYCESNELFYQVESIDKLLGIYNGHNNSISQAIYSYLDNNKNNLLNEIKNLLTSSDAYNISSWEDAEIESFKITSISELDPSIISIENQSNSCIVTMNISVEFEVTASGPDFINGYWDSEDKVMIPMESTTNTEFEKKEFQIELNIYYEIEGDKIGNISYDIFIEKIGQGIEFSVEEFNVDD